MYAFCEPHLLNVGVYAKSFNWDGVNWSGPSDTNNPKGMPFPAGDYELVIQALGSTNQGTETPFSVEASLVIRLEP
jgi:hypothetical protein